MLKKQHFLFVIGFVLALFITGYLLKPFIGYQSVGFLFLMGVLISGLVANTAMIIATAIASVLVWDLFFIPPLEPFTFNIQKTLRYV